MLIATTYCDKGQSVCQAEYEWVVFDADHTAEFVASHHRINEEYERQFNVPFEEVVDERALFSTLKALWQQQRGSTSSITTMVLSPAYQSIIGMGPRAIPHILRELRAEGDNPDHWFWALQTLTGTNPVPDASEGNLPEMAKAWLEWGASKGYAG